MQTLQPLSNTFSTRWVCQTIKVLQTPSLCLCSLTTLQLSSSDGRWRLWQRLRVCPWRVCSTSTRRRWAWWLSQQETSPPFHQTPVGLRRTRFAHEYCILGESYHASCLQDLLAFVSFWPSALPEFLFFLSPLKAIVMIAFDPTNIITCKIFNSCVRLTLLQLNFCCERTLPHRISFLKGCMFSECDPCLLEIDVGCFGSRFIAVIVSVCSDIVSFHSNRENETPSNLGCRFLLSDPLFLQLQTLIQHDY